MLSINNDTAHQAGPCEDILRAQWATACSSERYQEPSTQATDHQTCESEFPSLHHHLKEEEQNTN